MGEKMNAEKYNKINLGKFDIYWIRLLIQTAEIFGWTVVGYKLAYQINGDYGIIGLNITMLISATITSGLLSKSDFSFGKRIIKNAVLFRIISFISFICAWRIEEYEFIIIGGICSGIFVGLFWPVFYKIINRAGIDFKDWNAFDKFSAIILIISAVLIVEWLGSGLLLILSLLFLLISLIIISNNENIDYEKDTIDHAMNKAYKFTWMGTFKYPAILAWLEGFLNNSVGLSRFLVILSGTIVIGELPKILTLGGIIAVSTLFGALIPKVLKKIVPEKYLVNIGILISLISASLLFFESTWFFGIITITCGSSILFPIFKSEVESGFEKLNLGDRCWREYCRNQGRLSSSIILGIFWVINQAIISTFIVVTISSFFIAIVWFTKSKGKWD